MSIQSQLGKKGEQLAKDHLEGQGYEVLETNWRFKRAEIDIIAKDGPVLVFVEVKTRTADYFGPPELSVNKKKELLISDAAAAYMREVGHEWELRFDIIAIVIGSQSFPKIRHYKDAFFPGLR